jgi:hypothetical protein
MQLKSASSYFPAVTICNIKLIDQKNNPDFVELYLAPKAVYLSYT